VFGEVYGRKTNRLSVIAALNQKKLIAPFRFEGYCDSEVITTWAKECLAPCLKSGQTVILDNASFHKASKIKAIVESAGCNLLYLPPYSPDLNPIEPYWGVMKARIRKRRQPNQPLEEILDEVLNVS
jgi:transposase